MRPEGSKIEAEGREREWISWGGVSRPPLHQLGDFGERCELSQCAGFGAESRLPKGFPLFSACRMPSPDTIILLIVDHNKN